MNPIQIVEENAITYDKGVTRLFEGQYLEEDQIAWFSTGRRSLG